MTQQKPDPTEPLKRIQVYLYAKQRQALRIRAAQADVSMSEYIKRLIDKDIRDGDLQG